VATQVRTHTRRTLVARIPVVLDAPSGAAAAAALATLAAHERGAKLAR
jgi:hypothetical protein